MQRMTTKSEQLHFYPAICSRGVEPFHLVNGIFKLFILSFEDLNGLTENIPHHPLLYDGWNFGFGKAFVKW